MKKMKRLAAMLLALVMVLGMSITAFAGQTTNGVASKTDTATVTIEGISGNATVTLYQIATGVYGDSGTGLIKYEYINGITPLSDEPKSSEINKAHQEILALNGNITAADTQTNINGTYTSKELSVGAYIAIISEATDDSVYNPVLVTVSYDKTGKLVSGNVNVTNGYIFGSSAVAKKTMPSIDKKLKDDGLTMDGNKPTVGVGDKVTYEITPTMPSYPEGSKNKTFFVTDKMSAGLTFLYETLTVSIAGQTVTAETDNTGITRFVLGGNTIATAVKVENGFYLDFDYDKLISDKTTQAVYTPVVTYQAVLNDKAVVGGNGNPNDAKMYYANKPNEGNTFHMDPENPSKPDGSTGGVKEVEDKEIVYTYQLAFLKKGEGADADKLKDAVFGIYSDAECTKLVDVVKTNSEGIAVSSKVKAGTYYIKELVAPTGYGLNDKVYSIEATWATSTSKVTTQEFSWKYTTIKEGTDGVQVGWIDTKGTDDVKDDIFYAMDEYTEATETILPAYTVYNNTSVESSTITTSNAGTGTAASLIEVGKTENGGSVDYIPNTKMSALPSTGGIGTTIFTIGGCLIMIVAAGLFFASRKKSAK